MMQEAQSSATCRPSCVSRAAMSTGIVRVLRPAKLFANMNSFQEMMKQYTPEAMSPGLARGSTTRKKPCRRVQPSTAAASSSSLGMDWKKLIICQMT